MSKWIRNLVTSTILVTLTAAGAGTALADTFDLTPEQLHQIMVGMDKNKDSMVSKKELMKKFEAAMKAADPKGKGMYDEAMMRKLLQEFFSGGGQ